MICIFISNKILLWVIKLIGDDLWRIQQRTHAYTHPFRNAKIRGPKFEILIKRRVTLGLGMTMILLPRPITNVNEFYFILSSERGSRSPFQFWHRPSWWFIKMITRTAPTPPWLRFSYFGHDSSEGYSRFPVTKELSFVFLF